MENGAETIQENFSEAVSKTDDEAISGVKDFKDGLKMKGINLVDLFYPVGCIYQSTKNTDPSTMFGGTWGRIANGRTLVAVNESDTELNVAKKTGGSVNPLTEHTHEITGKTYRVGTVSGTTNTGCKIYRLGKYG